VRLPEAQRCQTSPVNPRWGDVIGPLKELGDEVTYKGPEHRMRVMLKSHPMIPVPMTAMKMATGAVSRNK
jgi:hypothetical protein